MMQSSNSNSTTSSIDNTFEEKEQDVICFKCYCCICFSHIYYLCCYMPCNLCFRD